MFFKLFSAVFGSFSNCFRLLWDRFRSILHGVHTVFSFFGRRHRRGVVIVVAVVFAVVGGIPPPRRRRCRRRFLDAFMDRLLYKAIGLFNLGLRDFWHDMLLISLLDLCRLFSACFRYCFLFDVVFKFHIRRGSELIRKQSRTVRNRPQSKPKTDP